eukprot:1199757-Rhodomonas_salina.2
MGTPLCCRSSSRLLTHAKDAQLSVTGGRWCGHEPQCRLQPEHLNLNGAGILKTGKVRRERCK